MNTFSAISLRAEGAGYYEIPLYESVTLKTASTQDAARILKRHTKDPDGKAYDIFLSHSFLDNALIAGIKAHFENMGHPTYVDWICDPQLDRSQVSKATTEQLRMRMSYCQTLFFAFSPNASKSKWMPWELGFIDGYRRRCALMRVAEIAQPTDEFSYAGVEYLSVYPFVNQTNTSLYIHRALDSWVGFNDWKSGSNFTWSK